MKTVPTNAAKRTDSPPAPELVCWKVWGGNGQAEVPVSIPGLRGHLYSRPCGSDRGGDLYYLSACGSGALARMCIADVTGHGEYVATFSGWLEEVFGKHIHRASPAVVLREVNRRAADRGLEVMSTAVCLSYNSLNGHLAFCNAGHPHVRLCRAGERRWQPLSVPADSAGQLDNLPLAVVSGAGYTIGRQQLNPGDRLLVHTDGLTEAQDKKGGQLGEVLWSTDSLPGSDVPVADVMTTLQTTVSKHIKGASAEHDDVTFMVLEVLPYQTRGRYTLLLKNNFERFMKALRGNSHG